MGRWTRALLALICAVALALALLAGPARADTFTVDSTGDAGDADSGNGTCATSGGECTLRAAIEEANDLAGADTINFAPSVSGTITLGGTQLIISSDIDLNGPGAGTLTVDANRASRVFNITNSGDATVKGLTVTGGNTTTTSGGGIFNNGTLTLTNSTVSVNRTFQKGGGIYNHIGDTLTLTNSTVSGNRASNGGGIYNGEGTLTFNNSTVSGNYADFDGGGIDSSTDDVTPTTQNPAERATIKNSTISGNKANFRGGGVYNSKGLTIIENSTITQNTASPGAGVASRGDRATRTDVLATIISNNTATDVDFVGDANTFRSLGSNIVGDGDATAEFNEDGDQAGVTDPKLGVLANNGGPTKTHKLLSGSPALDADVDECSAANDQRGVSRPQDGDGNGSKVCDIGSFELKDTTAPFIGKISPKKAIRARTPTIRATVRDNVTDLSKNHIVLKVKGKTVPKRKIRYDRAKDKLTYTVRPKLPRGKRVAVKIIAKDAAGNVKTKAWRFRIKR